MQKEDDPESMFNFHDLLNFPRQTWPQHHSLGEKKGGNSAVFGGTTVVYRSLPCSGGCMVGDQTCVDTDGRRLQRLKGGCFFRAALKVGLSDVKASECRK